MPTPEMAAAATVASLTDRKADIPCHYQRYRRVPAFGRLLLGNQADDYRPRCGLDRYVVVEAAAELCPSRLIEPGDVECVAYQCHHLGSGQLGR